MDQEEDGPLRPVNQSEELIDLSMDLDLEEKPSPEPWSLHIPPKFNRILRKVVERRKRKAKVTGPLGALVFDVKPEVT